MENSREIARRVESKIEAMRRYDSPLMQRGLEDIQQLEASPNVLRQVQILRQSPDWREKLDAWDKLREMDPDTPGWEFALQKTIFEGDDWARIFAAETLATHARSQNQAMPVLLALLESTLEMGAFDWARMACGALANYKTAPAPLAERAVELLSQALLAEDTDVQAYAALALGNFPVPSRSALVSLAHIWESVDERLAEHYRKVVQKIDSTIESPSEARLRALEDPRDEIRAQAVAAIGRRHREIASALPHLIKLTRDDCDDVRRNLALALGNAHSEDEEMFVQIAILTCDGHPEVRLAAAYASICQGRDIKKHAAFLRESLFAAKLDMRRLAAWALGRTGHHFPMRSHRALNKALDRETDPSTRRVIQTALDNLARASV